MPPLEKDLDNYDENQNINSVSLIIMENNNTLVETFLCRVQLSEKKQPSTKRPPLISFAFEA